MEAKLGGFLFPSIDENKCIRCGRCESTCPVLRKIEAAAPRPPVICYAAQNKDTSVLLRSSSGGIAAALENSAIARGVIVYGAAWDSPYRVAHKAAETPEDCQAFRQSKYIQSDIGRTYATIREQLERGRHVLFFGTPCQIEALYAITGRHGNLTTVSFYCHGVTSPRVFAEYLRYFEQNIGKRVDQFCFRDKTFGRKPSESFHFANINDPIRMEREWFLDLFLKNVSIRPSCLTCFFRLAPWASDITLSDFWEWRGGRTLFHTTKGLSKVFVNTPVGVSLWNEVRDKFTHEPVGTETTEKPAPQIRPVFERAFHRDFDRRGISFVLRKYPTVFGNLGRWSCSFRRRFLGKTRSVFFPVKFRGINRTDEG